MVCSSIAEVWGRGDRKQSAIKDEVYSAIAKIVQGDFAVPCAERTNHHHAALQYVYRCVSRLSVQVVDTRTTVLLGE